MTTEQEAMLLGELKQFKYDTTSRLARIENKLENLASFKWKLTGIAVAVFAMLQFISMLFKTIK